MQAQECLAYDDLGHGGTALYDVIGGAVWYLTMDGIRRTTEQRLHLPLFPFTKKQLRDGVGALLRAVALQPTKRLVRSDEICRLASVAFKKAKHDDKAYRVLRSGSSTELFRHEMMVLGYPEDIGRVASTGGKWCGAMVYEKAPVALFKTHPMTRFDMALRKDDPVSE